MIDALEAEAAAGEDVNLPGSPGGPSSDLEQLNEAAGLVKVGGGADRGFSASAVPGNFELRGSATSNRFAWTFNTAIAGGFCSSTCEETDRITVRWTINPGRGGDRFDFSSRYFPSTGGFSNIYGEGFAYCNGNFCGSTEIGEGGARDGNGSGAENLSHAEIPGGNLTNGVRFRATGLGKTEMDYAKTGQARCRTGSDRNCVY